MTRKACFWYCSGVLGRMFSKVFCSVLNCFAEKMMFFCALLCSFLFPAGFAIHPAVFCCILLWSVVFWGVLGGLFPGSGDVRFYEKAECQQMLREMSFSEFYLQTILRHPVRITYRFSSSYEFTEVKK